jgi:hypothetical protein
MGPDVAFTDFPSAAEFEAGHASVAVRVEFDAIEADWCGVHEVQVVDGVDAKDARNSSAATAEVRVSPGPCRAS